MDREQFLKQVTERADLSSKEEAEAVVRATLSTLAERIVGGEATDLAAQLPPEFGDALAGSSPEAERFDRDEFVSRVATRAGLDNAAAERAAQAVFAATREAVTAGEFEDVVAQLPNDYQPLLPRPGECPAGTPEPESPRRKVRVSVGGELAAVPGTLHSAEGRLGRPCAAHVTEGLSWPSVVGGERFVLPTCWATSGRCSSGGSAQADQAVSGSTGGRSCCRSWSRCS